MRQLTTYTMATSLLLAIGAISYAQDRQLQLKKHAVPSESEIAALASDYFDANWTLGADAGSSQPTAEDKLADKASDYLDANWRVTQESSTPAKPDSRSYADYFDANWAVFGRK